MKKWICALLTVGTLIGIAGESAAQQLDADTAAPQPRFRAPKPSSMYMVSAGGVVISPDYRDVMKQTYDDVEFAFGWLDLGLGFRINVGNSLSVTPGVDLLVNYVMGDNSFVNTIILPSVTARYVVGETPLYFQGGINYNIPNTGSEVFELESSGVGFSVAIGYTTELSGDVEICYLQVPVEILPRGEEKNFGGYAIRFVGKF